MAINNTTVVPKIIAAALIRAYRRQTVYAGRVNNTWRNALNANGDTVILNQPASVSISDYTANGTITYANADVGTPQELTISKRKA